MAATVVIRQLTTGIEATRILDALDALTDTPGDPLRDGRRYTIEGVTDRRAAVAHLQAHLDRISDTWPIHPLD